MAIMVPSFPYNFDPRSREDEMFFSLQKLPDDYFVFYSFTIANIINNTWKEKEIDFVIYNRNKGLMFVEAKAGKISCNMGIWEYENGKEMKDPFNQADNGRWKFKKDLEHLPQPGRRRIEKHCKLQLAVWFPSISRKSLKRLRLPANADEQIVLTAEDIENPLESIERIFACDVLTENAVHDLTDAEHEFLLNNYLCPSFNILPPKSFELDYKRKRFDAMIAEQSNILNYLELQRSAVINGAAGTGKTMIAVEKARRHSEAGEKVLFLCFNSKLQEHLAAAYPYRGVDYYTIDKFACKLCSTPTADFDYLENVLLEYDENGDFPYDHIIVDEGQDFGQVRMHTDMIFALLEDIVLKTENGTFYVFYDRLQMIQSEEVPAFIENADCRLTLYKNCRNTKRIAETSFRPLRLDKSPKLFDSALPGVNPEMIICDKASSVANLDTIIKKSITEEMDNIQIITCSTIEKSIYSKKVKDELYTQKNRKIPFTTARKFKGLEAEHVILVDVNKDILENQSMVFYVAASRAKFKLSIIANLDDEECTDIIHSFGSNVKRKNPKDTLATILGCKLLKDS